ncbi:MAG TPA: STAS domain-containing protein [Thermoleophilaceae bacterium]|nr:STAS domain-containing protein [Thermoleophilaceae bacterium]
MSQSASLPPQAHQPPLAPLLTVRSHSHGTTHHIAVAGELDISSVEEVRRVTEQALRGKPETLLLDLGELTFCDSSGIHLVLDTDRRASAASVRFRVIAPRGSARRTFEICQISDRVTFVTGDAAATG